MRTVGRICNRCTGVFARPLATYAPNAKCQRGRMYSASLIRLSLLRLSVYSSNTELYDCCILAEEISVHALFRTCVQVVKPMAMQTRAGWSGIVRHDAVTSGHPNASTAAANSANQYGNHGRKLGGDMGGRVPPPEFGAAGALIQIVRRRFCCALKFQAPDCLHYKCSNLKRKLTAQAFCDGASQTLDKIIQYTTRIAYSSPVLPKCTSSRSNRRKIQ